jgi:ferredoxin-NADP reductase
LAFVKFCVIHWETKEGGPLLLVAGGSGVAPLIAIIRHRTAAGSDVSTRLLYSSREHEEIIFADELDRFAASDA